MPWYFYSILSSLSLAGMVLLVRKLTVRGFSSKQILLFLCGFVFFGFLAENLVSPGPLWQSENVSSFLLVMLAAGFFAVIGNWANFESIKRASNPGYPAAIGYTTALPVLLFSVLFFQSELSILKFLGVGLVVLGIIFLVFDRKTNSDLGAKGFSWRFFAFLTLFSLTVVVMILKKATLFPAAGPKEINFLMFAVNLFGFSLLNLREFKGYFRAESKLKNFLPLVFLASVFSFLLNFLNIKGLTLAPNPGYHEAIKSANILFVTLLSLKLFSVRFEKIKILGIILISQ
ncbi:MAG: EamA family transporter [Candidatus Nealsonbacteria bacterium]|nr:EamA family transporter [Candidatus Nealsonbacteria bacterium]